MSSKAQRISEGIRLILKYDPKAEVAADRDIFFCGADSLPLSEDDRRQLEEWGWFCQMDSWAIFT